MRPCIFENINTLLTVHEPVYYTVVSPDTRAYVTKGGIALANKTVRELKVSAKSGYGYKPRSFNRLKRPSTKRSQPT